LAAGNDLEMQALRPADRLSVLWDEQFDFDRLVLPRDEDGLAKVREGGRY
jgi:hypothetical protein